MNAKLVGFFSGFPTRHFTDDIAKVLKEELTVRDSLVFISTWPDNYSQNDEDSDGMHNMFAERNMPFAKHSVIDNRTESEEAVRLIREASCIFLMGGNATLQFDLMSRKGILDEIRKSSAVILGVSAGSMNMGKHVVDIYESLIPYEGLGFAELTIKAHYPLEDVLLHTPSGNWGQVCRMMVDTSKRVASISACLSRLNVMLPLPLSEVERMPFTPFTRVSMDSNRLVTSDSITRDELPGIENETVNPGMDCDGESLTGNNGNRAKPTNDKQTNVTISVNGEKV